MDAIKEFADADALSLSFIFIFNRDEFSICGFEIEFIPEIVVLEGPFCSTRIGGVLIILFAFVSDLENSKFAGEVWRSCIASKTMADRRNCSPNTNVIKDKTPFSKNGPATTNLKYSEYAPPNNPRTANRTPNK